MESTAAGPEPAAGAEEGAGPARPAGTSAAQARARAAYAYYVHGNLQDLVKFTDQKAATIIGAGGIIVAVLGNNLIERFRADPLARWSGLVSIGLMVAAIASAVGVLWPRRVPEGKVLRLPGAPRLLWASDIAAFHGRPADYLRALSAVGPAEVLADLASESLKVSWILERKLRWQRRATQLLAVAFLSWLVTIGLALSR